MIRSARTGQVAAALGLYPATVQKYARENLIPFDATPGGHRRFNIDEVRAALGSPQVHRSRGRQRGTMISVEIRQDCYEKARPNRKPRLFITHRDYPAVPRIGEFVAPAPDWTAVAVDRVHWEADGSVVVYLEPEMYLDDEHLRLLGLGWSEPEIRLDDEHLRLLGPD
jgi:hypothetical protein